MSRVLPILFNTDMVQAIMEDRKTVTRRCVKPKGKNACGFNVALRESDNAFMGVYDYDENEKRSDNPQTPPYQPGDILYIRETFSEKSYGYEYKADGKEIDHLGNKIIWRPSIHMPKEAARIWLKVTDVRVERLQSMKLDDFLKEGIVIREESFNDPENAFGQTRTAFKNIWDSTIKKSELDMYGWDANPYTWVIEFERCEKPEVENEKEVK